MQTWRNRSRLLLAAGGLAIAAPAAAAGALAGHAATQPPTPTSDPVITGLSVGAALSVGTGTWDGSTPMSFTYTWARTNASGGWDPIPGAKSDSYTTTADDVGHRLLVQVKALNSAGRAWRNSALTPVVVAGAAAPAVPTTKLPDGSVSIAAANVALPDRLQIAPATFQPAALARGGTVVARVKVTDTQGHVVDGARVDAIALPFGGLRTVAQAATGADGVATLVLRSGDLTGVRGAIALQVRATKPGGNVLAGVSTRRLLKLPLAG